MSYLPSKRKLASEVIRALHDFDDPGSPAIRRLISDRAPEFFSAGRTLGSFRPFAHFVTVPYRHASRGQTERQWNHCQLGTAMQRKSVNHHLQSAPIAHWNIQINDPNEHVGSDPSTSLATDPCGHTLQCVSAAANIPARAQAAR